MKSFVARLVILGAALVALVPAALTAAQAGSPLDGTEWTLVSIDGAAAIPGTTVTLAFEGLEGSGRVSGNGGCNSYGGSYSLDGDALSISEVFSTLMACMDDNRTEQESAYFEALQAAAGYRITGNVLTITTEDGGALVFSQGTPLLGTQWVLATIDGNEVVAGSSVTLTFGDEGQLSGNGGCNGFGGSYSLEDLSLSISEVMSTKMACADDAVTQQESTFFDRLSAADSYSIDGDTLTLVTADGDALIFQAAPALPGSEWTLVSIDGAALADGSTITLTFMDAGRAGGDSGCNRYSTGYSIDGAALRFTPVMSTRMACADPAVMQQETAYLSTLEAATGYRFDGETLVVSGAGGALVFEPLSSTDAA